MGALQIKRHGVEILSALFLMALLLAAPPARAQSYETEGDARGELGDGGVILWFTSMMRTKGVTANTPVTICIKNQAITWREGKKVKTLKVPDAKIAFKPWESSSHTYFGKSWDTSHPPSTAPSDSFMAGVSLPLPDGLPRGMSDVSWQGKFESDTKGITVQWKWAVLAYTHFMDDYNALDVAPADTDLGRLRARSWPACPATAGFPRPPQRRRGRRGRLPRRGCRAATAVPKASTCGGIY